MTKTDIERMLEDPELHPDFRKDLELQLSEIINNENLRNYMEIKLIISKILLRTLKLKIK